MPHILIQRIDRLGDMICALPVIEALKVKWPNSKITVVASPANSQIVENHPHVNDVIVFSRNGRRVSQFFKTISLIRKRHFDIAILLYPSLFWAWVCTLSRIPIRIGNGFEFISRLLVTHPVYPNYSDPSIHEVMHNLTFLKPLGLNQDRPIITLHKNLKSVSEEINSILIFIGSGGSNSGLSPAVIEPVINLCRANNWTVCICGGFKQDMTEYEYLTSDTVSIASPLLSISELVDLISKSDVYIGGDTGPTHIASFLNRPMVTYFPETGNQPSRWGSFSEYHQVVHRTDDLKSAVSRLQKSISLTDSK
jgi:ADP-heptose:LPS heptosyltransferase